VSNVKGKRLKLDRTWIVGDRIGGGGFGQVFSVTSEGESAAAKLVPKAPGADRELLFVNLPDVRNVVPIIDSGEYGKSWVLVMPRADQSLREVLASPGAHELEDVVKVLKDITDALVDMEGKVVHRDLKPENILLLEGNWCLADFGISRYAEATTAPDTQKFALSPPYAGPERWRNERATTATDVYAVGVIAYEMVVGELPFSGPSIEAFRDQHLHADAPRVENIPSAFGALIDECLYKAPEARPTAANLRARLDRLQLPAVSGGLARLEEANRDAVARRADSSRRESEERTEAERRSDLAQAAARSFEQISATLKTAITQAATAANVQGQGRTWSITLNQATLTVSPILPHAQGAWGGWQPPAFDVISVASINLRIPRDRYDYEGRSHSLWYGDIQATGNYRWFEAAFMVSPFIAQRGSQDPFALDPGEESAKAVWSGMAEFQLAWPFTELTPGDLDEFVDRWAAWFAQAAQGQLTHPSSMPERSPQGTWRRS
jgi:serine/threonine protein kinase